jgi:hypothetical protein
MMMLDGNKCVLPIVTTCCGPSSLDRSFSPAGDPIEEFVEALGRHQKEQSFLKEIPEDVEKKPSQGPRDDGMGRAS